MKTAMLYFLGILVVLIVTAAAAYAAIMPQAQGDPLQQCFGGISDITDITLDDLLACVEVLKELGDRVLVWLLALIKDVLDHFGLSRGKP